ncbi:MAG: mechanosensitive ion channel domain-containing protein [Dongiaceae bacterium]
MLAASAMAQESSTAPVDDSAPKVRQLLELLADPAVRDWIEQRRQAADEAPAVPSQAATSTSGYVAGRITAIRAHLAALAAAAPTIPRELNRTSIILSLEFQERGLVNILILIATFVGLGFGVEWLFRRMTRDFQHWFMNVPLVTAGQRLRAVAIRLGFGLGLITAFAVGSVGAFLAFDWPPLLREIVLGYLIAFLVLRLALVFGRFLLAPGGERFRILPMSTPAAWFWYRRLGFFVGWFAFGWVSVELLVTLGMAVDVVRLIAYVLGLGLLAIGLESVWRRPADGPAVPEPDAAVGQSHPRRIKAWLLSGYFLLIWLLWVLSAIAAFWLAVVAVGLPLLDLGARRAVNHVLRPPQSARGDDQTPSVIAASLARGLRMLFIIGGALLLARAWHIDLIELTAGDTLLTRLLRGALNAVVIVLVADFAWHVFRAVIDRKIGEAQATSQHGSEETRRRSRMRTLLPILRNIVFVVLLVMALLMALSALGIEIGPLIAGAGVVGVAVGFGAQTLVKDIISGMFYLLDDAFRVGEYIQSGSYKGTVESFSLRSVKLRHHRGPLYTVPFGELGAVQNMSRDWVIDKLTIGVTYDTDLDKAKKLIKQIGKELEQDPEFKSHILETLKMQGVEQFGDFAIQLRMKMMTKPGEQFVIRRKAFALIKKAFDANGIRFAFPTVQVAGGDDAMGAVAQQALARASAPPQAT